MLYALDDNKTIHWLKMIAAITALCIFLHWKPDACSIKSTRAVKQQVPCSPHHKLQSLLQ